MIDLKILATGSSGNCYVLTADSGRKLILDAGIRFKEITRQLDYDLLSIDGVLITHNHGDHSLSAADFEKSGIRAWKPYRDENKVQKAVFGEWKVMSFDVEHDNEPCTGFLIEKNGFRMIYATDLSYTKYVFKKLNVDCILIECNYMDELINSDIPYFAHKVKGHLSLKNCIEFIKANQNKKLKNVVLCHMGLASCDGEECIRKIKENVNENVCVSIAVRGESIAL